MSPSHPGKPDPGSSWRLGPGSVSVFMITSAAGLGSAPRAGQPALRLSGRKMSGASRGRGPGLALTRRPCGQRAPRVSGCRAGPCVVWRAPFSSCFDSEGHGVGCPWAGHSWCPSWWLSHGHQSWCPGLHLVHGARIYTQWVFTGPERPPPAGKR